jgi:hypothetical protein
MKNKFDEEDEDSHPKGNNKFFRADRKNRKFTKFVGKVCKPENDYKRIKINVNKLNLEED